MAKEETGLIPFNLAETLQLADHLKQSGCFPGVTTASKALAKILAGRELGFGIVASLMDIHFFDDKLMVGAHLRAASIKRSGQYDYKIHRADFEVCDIEYLEKVGTKWESMGRIVLTIQEAQEHGWDKSKDGKPKANWLKHADDMLFARNITKGYRRYTPDLSGGVLVYDPDEFDAEVADGEIRSGTRGQTTLVEMKPAPQLEAPKPQITIPIHPSAPAAITTTPVFTQATQSPPPVTFQSPQPAREPGVAVADGAGAGAAGPVPSGSGETAAAPEVPEKVTLIQAQRIDELTSALSIPIGPFNARLKQVYGAENGWGLTRAQADEVIRKLEAAAQHSKGKPAA